MLDTKQESWAAVVQEVEEMPGHNATYGPLTAFILPLLQACLNAGLDDDFRVGMSMSHIIFSTAERHGLPPHVPRVTLMHDPEKQQWSIAWSYQNLSFSKPDHQDFVNSGNAFLVLKKYLSDLWRETRPNEAIPASLISRVSK